MKLKVPFDNIPVRSAILTYLWGNGYKRRNNLPNTLESVNRHWSNNNIVDTITIDTKTKIVDATRGTNEEGREISLIELFSSEFDKVKPVSIKLNSEYTAEVSEDSIKVGCQVFPIGIIDDLVSARKQVTLSN